MICTDGDCEAALVSGLLLVGHEHWGTADSGIRDGVRPCGGFPPLHPRNNIPPWGCVRSPAAVSALFVQLMSRNGSPSPGGGSGRGGGGGANDYFVDPKLLYRIKQFVGEAHERGSVPTEDAAVDHLLDKFKEYVRKPQVCVRACFCLCPAVFRCSVLVSKK